MEARCIGLGHELANDFIVEDEKLALHEEDVVDLLARALARSQMDDVGFCDPVAFEVARELGIDVAHRLEDPAPLRRSLAVTMLVDGLARHFFERHPDGLAIGLHQGLCTRFSRVDTGLLRWVDVDEPAVAELKRSALPAHERRDISACCSLSCAGWLEELASAGEMPTLIVAQRSLGRATARQAASLLFEACRWVRSGTELIVDYDARLPLRASGPKAASCLELPLPDGTVERFPRIRFVLESEYGSELAHDLRGLNGVSRLFRGRGVRSVAHLRFG